MIWLIGFTLVICVAIFYAGFKFDSLFMEKITDYKGVETGKVKFNDAKFFGLAMTAVLVAILWPVLVPAGSLFLLGKKLAK